MAQRGSEGVVAERERVRGWWLREGVRVVVAERGSEEAWRLRGE